MNNNKKIEEITKIVEYYHKKICPYCGSNLIPFLKGIDKRLGCKNGHESIEVHEIDYMHVIANIVKFSTPVIKNKFKSLTEF